MQPIRIAVTQMGPSIGHVEDNLVRMELFASRARVHKAGLICFPEACATGYCTQGAAEVAMAQDDDVLIAFEAHVHDLGMAVSYGFIERSDEGLHIAHVVSDKTSRMVYRKTHLGSREQGVFRPGSELPVARVGDVMVGVQLCWESHIPDISTTLRAKGAELLLMPFASGATGARRRETWQRYLPARAYDNGCYVAACNALRADDGGVVRGGGVCVYRPDGTLMKDYYGSDERTLLCTLTGPLPREVEPDGMRNVSYFDKRRPELYC